MDGYASSEFGLHRVLSPWGEGNKSPVSNPGFGLPATAGEATWNDRFALQSAPWNAPGGVAGSDYAAAASSGTFIYDVGSSPYVFASTPALVSDVQGWLNNPVGNFGWMLISQSENVDFTARRFASREDLARAPVLEIQYTVVPKPSSVALLTVGGFAALFYRRSRGGCNV